MKMPKPNGSAKDNNNKKVNGYTVTSSSTSYSRSSSGDGARPSSSGVGGPSNKKVNNKAQPHVNGLPSVSQNGNSGDGPSSSDDDIEVEDGSNILAGEMQDPKERRRLRHKYRSLGDELQKNQHDLINPESAELDEKLNEVNELFHEVKMTREAAMDAQCVAAISNLARQKAQALHTDFVVFQPVEYAEKIVSYVSGHTLPDEHSQQRSITRAGWENLGSAVQPFFRRAPPLHLMFGSFEREKKPPKLGPIDRKPKDKDANAGKATVPQQLKSVGETKKKKVPTATLR